jgi:hypothetical protein
MTHRLLFLIKGAQEGIPRVLQHWDSFDLDLQDHYYEEISEILIHMWGIKNRNEGEKIEAEVDKLAKIILALPPKVKGLLGESNLSFLEELIK